MIPDLTPKFERAAAALRHQRALRRLDVLWNVVRPLYDRLLEVVGRTGLPRTINGTDRILVAPAARGVSDRYEPDVWARAMGAVHAGDTVVDIGAFVGLYTVAFAQRTGPSGCVVAFEPDPQNFAVLRRHVDLNAVKNWVEIHQFAVTGKDGPILYDARGGSEAQVGRSHSPDLTTVRGTTLNSVMGPRRIDVLKIDVEGHEEEVLRGASDLLFDEARAPRAIFIEAHPYAWSSPDSGRKLILRLTEAGYTVTDVTGQSLDRIEVYGEVIATRSPMRDLGNRPAGTAQLDGQEATNAARSGDPE